MDLIADENIWASMIAALRAGGHLVDSIRELRAGISDPEVLGLGFDRGVLVVTADKGYGSMVYRQGLPTAGVLLLRIRQLDEEQRNALVLRALATHEDKLIGRFTVLTADEIRMREI